MPEYVTTIQTITRGTGTTALTAKDVLSAGTTVPLAFSCSWNGGKVVKTVIKTDLVGFTGDLRLWFFTNSAESLAADNAALNMTYAGSYIGYVDVTLAATGTGCCMGMSLTEIPFGVTTANLLYAVLTTLGTQTPGSGQKISVEITTANG